MTSEPPSSQRFSLFVPDELDGAASHARRHLPRLVDDRAVAADPSRPTAERVAAFERLRATEVGETAFVRARNLERELGLRRLFLKFEGGNPTGSQKDRIAFAQVRDALLRGYESITVATCGNFGAALAFAASLGGLRCVACIPEAYHTKRIAEIEALGAEIVRTPGDYERAVDLSRSAAEATGLYDANPGGANSNIQVRAYADIADEIVAVLGDAPAAVGVPVSNGTTLAGVAIGFSYLCDAGATSRMPRMVAGSSFGNNPIVAAVAAGLASCDDLAPESIRESRVNEPLVNWHALDGDDALRAVRGSDGWAAEAGDRRLLELATRVRRLEGLNVLPASTASLYALAEGHKRLGLPVDDYVAVLTGRRE